MLAGRWLRVTTETIGALVLVLLFAALGASGTSFADEVNAISWANTIHIGWQLISDVLHGTHLRAEFWGISWTEVWATVRLAAVSFAMSIVFGVGFACLRIAALTKAFSRAVMSFIFTILESVPDTMYVLIVVMLVLFLSEHTTLALPVFSSGSPTWADTWVPAAALCLPGALFLQRIVYMKLRDERFADYVATARAKGASSMRVATRHLLPNMWPTVLRQAPVVFGLILSGAMFTEYFFEYSGVLYTFTNWATGYDFNTGLPPVDLNWASTLNAQSLQQAESGTGALGVTKPPGIPHYQVGLVFLIGGLLVLLWAVGRGLSESLYQARYGTLTDLPAPRYERHRLNWSSLAGGAVLLAVILLLGAFPSVLTGHQPALSYDQMANFLTFGPDHSAPPGGAYPLGRDVFGRDLLSLTLYGTYYTLWPVAAITGLVFVCSFVVAMLAFAKRNSLVQKLVQYVGACLAGVPVLMVVFLALYQGDLFTNNRTLHYILWITLFEVGHGSYTLWTGMDEWRSFRFSEGAHSLGRGQLGTLFTHYKSWLGYFILEFIFSEFARVLSLMVQLAAFRVFMVSEIGYLSYAPGMQGVIPAYTSWVNMIGESTGTLSYIYAPYSLYAPVLALVATMVAVNLIASGLRGKDRSI